MKNIIVFKHKKLHVLTTLIGGIICATVLPGSNAVAQSDAAAQIAFQQDRDLALQDPRVDQIPGSVIVKFSPAASRGQAEGILRTLGASRIKDFALVPGLSHIRIPVATGNAIEALRRNPLVEFVEPDFVVQSGQSTVPNDQHFGLQWGLRNSGKSINGTTGVAGADIRAAQAWSVSTGGAGCLVAVIDSGIQLTHPDLNSNVWRNPNEVSNGLDSDGNGYVDDLHGWDFVDNNNNPADANGHGTHVAGTIAAVSNNKTGVAGVAWDCKVMALRFLNANGSGTVSGAISALEYAVSNGARISNNSWGGGSYSRALYDAIRIAGEQHGHLFVAAAGNSGLNSDSQPAYPAAYDLPNIISVAATDNRDRLASFSNYGANTVDIGAPGVDIASTYINNGYFYMSGTSMAAPHVSGTAGLIANLYPHASVEDMVLVLLGSARPLSSLAGKTTTGGMLDAFTSLQNAGALLASTPIQPKPEPQPEPEPEREPEPEPEPVTVTEPDPVVAPLAPSNLTAVNNRNNSATTQWHDNSDNETGFVLEREKLTGGGRWQSNTQFNLPEKTQTYTDNSGAGTFRYRIRAQNSAGSSPATDWVIIEVTRR